MKGAIQKRNSDALSTITYAASNGDVDTVRNLLARGVPINQGDYDNRTTLHLASSEGNLRVVEVLLQEGADPNMRDRWSGTPLSDAISNKRTQVVELLRKYDAKLVYVGRTNQSCKSQHKELFDQAKHSCLFLCKARRMRQILNKDSLGHFKPK